MKKNWYKSTITRFQKNTWSSYLHQRHRKHSKYTKDLNLFLLKENWWDAADTNGINSGAVHLEDNTCTEVIKQFLLTLFINTFLWSVRRVPLMCNWSMLVDLDFFPPVMNWIVCHKVLGFETVKLIWFS